MMFASFGIQKTVGMGLHKKRGTTRPSKWVQSESSSFMETDNTPQRTYWDSTTLWLLAQLLA